MRWKPTDLFSGIIQRIIQLAISCATANRDLVVLNIKVNCLEVAQVNINCILDVGETL